VREGQPVGSVGEEWVVDAVGVECCVNLVEPKCDVVGQQRIPPSKISQPCGFLFEREGGDAAEDQSGDEERESQIRMERSSSVFLFGS
jgi:hypothetical protein